MASESRPAAWPGATAAGPRSPAQIEADIIRTRRRLAANLDEIAERVNPRTVARRTRESVRDRVGGAAAQPPSRAVIGAGVAVALLLGLVVWRRRR